MVHLVSIAWHLRRRVDDVRPIMLVRQKPFPLQQGRIGERTPFKQSLRLPMIVCHIIHTSEVVGRSTVRFFYVSNGLATKEGEQGGLG